MANLVSHDIESLKLNPIEKFKKQWFLISVGTTYNDYNLMTANWATIGYLWNKPVISIFIRPQRYTYNFIESNQYVCINFLSKKYNNILTLCGSRSGKQINKKSLEGISVTNYNDECVFVDQSELVIISKKIFKSNIKSKQFLENKINDLFYADSDYHTMYVLEIETILMSAEE